METKHTTGTITGDLEKQKQRERYEAYLRECRLCEAEMLIKTFKNRGESFNSDCHNRFNELHTLYTNIIETFSKSPEQHASIEFKLKEFKDTAFSIWEKFSNKENDIMAQELKLLKVYRYGAKYHRKVYENAVSTSLELQKLRSVICLYIYTLGGYITPDSNIHLNKSKCIVN